MWSPLALVIKGASHARIIQTYPESVMRVLYRTITSAQPSNVRSPMSAIIWRSSESEEAAAHEVICINMSRSHQNYGIHSNLFLPTPFDAISTLEFYKSFPADQLNISGLFSVLQFMPHLQDLTIDVNIIHSPTRPSALSALPSLPFHLRRLVLSQVFPGWAHLIHHSADTLEVLALGLRWDGLPYSGLLADVPLSVLGNLRALRVDDTPDATIFSGCPRLASLALQGLPHDLELAQLYLRRPLARLEVLYSAFDSAKAWALAEALARFSVLGALRQLEIETDEGEEFRLAGDLGREALAELCVVKGISVSVSRTRGLDAWERLDA
ncbi:hypothetical protein AURDEDRAFT_182639 [Auricularia subglabra TFB-10046 SS5]|nr:hypothetical protein AURDEDRAFT_182639 [Auricularia subglabra TFB-10046 SS5]